MGVLSVQSFECERGGRTLFAPLSFQIASGRATFVYGANGSGKSTLLRALAGLTDPTGGQARWDGELVRLRAPPWRRLVLYLGHKLALKEELSAQENLQLAVQLEGGNVPAQALSNALARVGLLARRGVLVKGLSQGQRQRLALARLCLSKRRIWLLDEPSAALDTAAKRLLAQIVDEHLAQGGCALIATHEPIELSGSPVAELQLD